MLRSSLLSCAAALTFAACDARTSPPVPDACPGCEIVLEPVGRLTDEAAIGMLPDWLLATRDRHERLLVIAKPATSVLVFDRFGGLLRQLGAAGSGPGEFRNIRRVFAGPGDSIVVSDWGTRITVFSPDLKVARMHPATYLPTLMLPDGRYVVADKERTGQQHGAPIDIVRPDGTIDRSLGAPVTDEMRDSSNYTNRMVGLSRDGTLWAVAPGRYAVEQWDIATGALRRTIPIASTWFRGAPDFPGLRFRPPSVIEAFWEGEDGLLWFLIRDADVAWQPPHDSLGDGERSIPPEEWNRTHDWVVEAVDPATGAVAASRRFPEILWGRIPSGVLVAPDSASSDGTAFVVWHPVLRKPAAP